MGNKLFNNPKPAIYIIWAFVALLILFLIYNDAEASETRLEVGPTFLSTDPSHGVAVMISEVWADKFLVGFGLIGQQDGKFSEGTVFVENNIMVQGQFVVQGPARWSWSKDIEMGAGLAFFQNTNRALGLPLVFSLTLGYERPQRGWRPDRFNYRHYSNAGSGSPNGGQDLLMFGWDF